MLREGGTLAVFLGCHALKAGFSATIFTYNLHIFDPTWFGLDNDDFARNLSLQRAYKQDSKLHQATEGYLEFLRLGGRIQQKDLTPGFLRNHLKAGHPLITGLSCTYLYRSARDIQEINKPDPIRGQPTGHFVVLYGYDPDTKLAELADPFLLNPYQNNHYSVDIMHLIGSIFLGIVTSDANILLIRPRKQGKHFSDLTV
jgi:hypothetical protein